MKISQEILSMFLAETVKIVVAIIWIAVAPGRPRKNQLRKR